MKIKFEQYARVAFEVLAEGEVSLPQYERAILRQFERERAILKKRTPLTINSRLEALFYMPQSLLKRAIRRGAANYRLNGIRTKLQTHTQKLVKDGYIDYRTEKPSAPEEEELLHYSLSDKARQDPPEFIVAKRAKFRSVRDLSP